MKTILATIIILLLSISAYADFHNMERRFNLFWASCRMEALDVPNINEDKKMRLEMVFGFLQPTLNGILDRAKAGKIKQALKEELQLKNDTNKLGLCKYSTRILGK